MSLDVGKHAQQKTEPLGLLAGHHRYRAAIGASWSLGESARFVASILYALFVLEKLLSHFAPETAPRGLTTSELTLLSRSGTTGRAADGEYLFGAEFLFSHRR